MENFLSRYRNVSILVAVLFAQVLGLAVQVKRSTENESTRLIRVWTVSAVSPLEKAIVWFQSGTSNLWHSYVYLRGVRQENRELKDEIEKLRLERVRLVDDAEQARRLQALLGFKEQYISKTIAAQVIGSSGSEQSRSVYIDKGSSQGLEKDMPVITADGVIGRVLKVYPSTSQVLLINDQTSGVGAILEQSRLQGILRGTPAGEVILEKVMSDETVQPGEKVLTSGGDQIFPKGLPIGTVSKVTAGPEVFLNVRVRPATNLNKLEEVLVITRKEERSATVAETAPARAVDILSQRLPSVPDKPRESAAVGSAKTAGAPNRTAGSVPAPQAPAVAKGIKDGAPKSNEAPSTGDAMPGPKVPPVAKSAKGGTAGTDSASTPTPGSVKPAIAQKPAPPAVKVSQQVPNPASAPPKPKPEQQPVVAPVPPGDKPQ
ncbi:MAG: rod shape-determining protein MreC [Acidobacteria bacterium]|nr:MAG: rod shape-determining protein MreC [Acidobacteriota bacterium]